MTSITGPSTWRLLFPKLARARESARRSTGHPVVDEMLECIHENVFEHDFNVGRLRDLCNIADNNQSSRFRLLVGAPPRAYIEGLRLDTAARLLREHPDAKVLDIGFLVGYENPQTFYRAFRRRYGAAPGKVRERHLGPGRLRRRDAGRGP